MADRPLLSIVVPTWQRHELLLGLLDNIRRQTYPNVEVVIVSDGPDPDLRHALWSAGHRPADVFTDGGCQRLRLVELGRQWTQFVPNSYGIGAITAGLLLARGEYLTWWSDDDRATLDHLTKLTDALEADQTDFAYGITRHYWSGMAPGSGYDIGCDPPQLGHVTVCVFRAALLRYAMPKMGTHPVDWSLMKAWMDAGARWSFVPELTFYHRADLGKPA